MQKNVTVLNAAADVLYDGTVTYLTDDREIKFFLWELFTVDKEFLGSFPFDRVDRARCEALLAQARAHAADLARANRDGDRDPARRLPDGTVAIPASYLPLWEEHLREWFWLRRQSDTVTMADTGALRFPHGVLQAVIEMLVGANPSFMTYAGFTQSAFNLIRVRGTDRQKDLFLGPLERVEWDACFCATEPDAGTDLAAVRTEAEQVEGEVYAVRGEKKYITAGMHELTSNTVYLVLGRVKGVSPSSLNLSCFIVPRYWVEADGSLVSNHVDCAQVEDKMGLGGCANTHLVFGGRGVTRGFLLGNRPNVALLQLSMLMRKARIGTGQMALAMASSAYLHSLRYARTRIQSASVEQASTPKAPRVPIIAHLDVQRMLLEMRAKVEGCRGLLGKISHHSSKLSVLTAAGDAPDQKGDKKAAERHGRLAMLFAPIAKAYISDEAWRVVTQAIQVHGAVGYLRDLPLEQYARDIKILSIWEGTNHIQAMDLVRDKLGYGRQSLAMRDFEEDVRAFLARGPSFPDLQPEFAAVEGALASLSATLTLIGAHADGGRLALISQFATRFLEMFGEVILGWIHLETATIASAALAGLPEQDADHAFYRGKIKTARFFIHNILPGVAAKVALLRQADQSYVAMDSEEFGFTDGGLHGQYRAVAE